ncbi:Zn-ribbon domain-containing OB-fold protein [Nocardia sp. NPDC002869]|uniref:Zn-ribbon domain-containing OB-fold protein n=1 Tax=Nocardia sp. NPDC002869 TaxID=3161032 RepID=UPI00398D4814
MSTLPTPVESFTSPHKVDYTFVAGTGRSTFLRGLKERRLLARRCPSCERVYLPFPEFCSRCLVELAAPFELDGTGVVTTFCVVNFPFPGQVIDPPYLVAYIQVDGADTTLMHLIRDIELADVHIGMRVEPVWCAEEDLDTSMNSIRYYRPVAGGSDA